VQEGTNKPVEMKWSALELIEREREGISGEEMKGYQEAFWKEMGGCTPTLPSPLKGEGEKVAQ